MEGPVKREKPKEEPKPEPKQSFKEKYKLKCSLTGSMSLRYNNRDDDSTRPGKPRLSLGCGMRFNEKLSLRVSLIGYLNKSQQEDWDPDFTYALTYRLNEKVSFGYSNYSGRFNGAEGNFVDAITSGNLRASFKLPKIKLPNDKTISCTASVGLPNPIKESTNVSCGYAFTPKFRVQATAYLYFPGEQGQYQPDFSYTASYQINDDWRVSYSNFSNNRWPWNRGQTAGPGILGGSVSVTYALKF